jgi:hypothetical protein
VGLAVLGIAFCIATAIQLQGVLTFGWHRDYREDLPRRLMLAVFAIGHVGFAGRAGEGVGRLLLGCTRVFCAVLVPRAPRAHSPALMLHHHCAAATTCAQVPSWPWRSCF